MLSKKIGRGNNRIRKELHAIKIMNERKKMSKKIVRSTISSIYGQTKHKFERFIHFMRRRVRGRWNQMMLEIFLIEFEFFLELFSIKCFRRK